MRTVVDALAQAASGTNALTTFRGGRERVMPWAQVHDQARRLATFLGRQGIRRGGRVGLCAGTSAELMVAIQAVWLAGAAVSVLPPAPSSDSAARQRLLADARLDLLLADTALGQAVAGSAHLPQAPVVPPDLGDLAILQYTSGSTSDPRGVPVTHRHLAANLVAVKETFGYAGESIRMLSWRPLYHDMGLIGFACLPMAGGWPLVLQSPTSFAMRPMGWLEAVSRYRITTTGAPPTSPSGWSPRCWARAKGLT